MATLHDAQRAFQAHLPIMLGRINQRCWDDETRQNALCWAWYRFQQLYPAKTLSPEKAAASAAHYATGRARFRTFGSAPRPSRYLDAMAAADTVSLTMDVARDDDCPDDDPPPIRIDWLPLRLRVVAMPLSAGLTQRQVAERTGIPLRSVERRVAELRSLVDRERGETRQAA